MHNIELIHALHRHCDWANDTLLQSAEPLNDVLLDQPIDMGVGSLRKTLLHIYNGEYVWLQRWQGKTETKWPDEEEKVRIAHLRDRFHANSKVRSAFLQSIQSNDGSSIILYRDSKGRLFNASLLDMLIQGFTHSTYHRAQAVNMIRRVGGSPPEVDYMYWVRKPA